METKKNILDINSAIDFKITKKELIDLMYDELIDSIKTELRELCDKVNNYVKIHNEKVDEQRAVLEEQRTKACLESLPPQTQKDLENYVDLHNKLFADIAPSEPAYTLKARWASNSQRWDLYMGGTRVIAAWSSEPEDFIYPSYIKISLTLHEDSYGHIWLANQIGCMVSTKSQLFDNFYRPELEEDLSRIGDLLTKMNEAKEKGPSLKLKLMKELLSRTESGQAVLDLLDNVRTSAQLYKKLSE